MLTCLAVLRQCSARFRVFYRCPAAGTWTSPLHIVPPGTFPPRSRPANWDVVNWYEQELSEAQGAALS